MSEFKPKTSLDKIFEVSILLKAADGLLEVIGGIFLFIIDPDRIVAFVTNLTRHELALDPHDFIANHLLHSAQTLTSGSLIFGALYLLSHGIAKIVLVIEILRNHLWAYLGLIILTVLFMIYQTYRISYTFSVSLLLLTIFDAFIVYITTREYLKQRVILNKPTEDISPDQD